MCSQRRHVVMATIHYYLHNRLTMMATMIQMRNYSFQQDEMLSLFYLNLVL